MDMQQCMGMGMGVHGPRALQVGDPLPRVDLLLTLLPAPCCVRFNFHPSMVITGFFLDPSC